MKICAAQIRPEPGLILHNTERHKRFIKQAVELQAELIFFPELSLTGFEPELAQALAMSADCDLLDDFQRLSDEYRMMIGLGVPLLKKAKVQIGMVWFQPRKPRTHYAKQILHPDEFAYFSPGHDRLLLDVGLCRIAPAICYESLQPVHSDQAVNAGANLYLASVAKPQAGIIKACQYYPNMAEKHRMPVIMANSVGPCDDFISAGYSAAWDINGRLMAQMDDQAEGLLMVDTDRNKAEVYTVSQWYRD